MNAALDDPAVRAYLAELRRALAHRPEQERDLVVDGVQQHIADALGDGPADAPHVQRVLDGLGDPMAIAAEASPPQEAAAAAPAAPAAVPLLDRRGGAVLAVLVLVVGGFVVPVLGWVAGVAMLWSSRGWTRRDKVVGTVAPAAGAAAGVLVAWLLTAIGLLDGWAHLGVLLGLLLGVVAGAVFLLRRFRPLG